MHEQLKIRGRMELLNESVGVETAREIRLDHEAVPHPEQLQTVVSLVAQSRIAPFDLMATDIIERSRQAGIGRPHGGHSIAEAELRVVAERISQ